MNAIGIQTRHLIKKDHRTDVNIVDLWIFDCSDIEKKIEPRVIFMFYDLDLTVSTYRVFIKKHDYV